ncbi:cobalt transporter subunit CbtB [Rhizobium sp. BE258]|nr:CbtB-domain containing protein [Rhizobium sp. BE258]MDR7145054.1 cobalt transporter subunit CbtB [Rhizobium sp. BE258]
MSASTTHSATRPAISIGASRLLQSAAAAFFGIAIVGFVGFSHLEAVHNAAHDTRHANAFPCH